MHRFIGTFTAMLLGSGLIASPVLAAAPAANAAVDDQQTDLRAPQVVASETVDHVLALLEENRQLYKRNSDKLYAMINRVLVPHFDIPFIAKLVLGRHWRAASPEQRAHFTELFKTMLVHTYGNALLGFDDEQIEYLPVRAEEGATDITFRAEVTMENGDAIPVTLDMHVVDGKWKIYNGSVGNLSFVINYRAQFNAQIAAGGLAAVLKKMEKRYGASAASPTDENTDQPTTQPQAS